MADRTFAKFTFFKIDPEWRRRDPDLRAADKQEFLAACDDFALDRSLRAYSTIGTRGDVDLVLLSQSPNLDDLHTFHVVLGQSGLAKWSATPYSFLSMTKRSPYSEEGARPQICVSERKYLFLYPMVKQRRWYGLSADERLASMAWRVSQTVVAHPRPAARFTSRLALQNPVVCSSSGRIPTRIVSVMASRSPWSQLTRQHSP